MPKLSLDGKETSHIRELLREAKAIVDGMNIKCAEESGIQNADTFLLSAWILEQNKEVIARLDGVAEVLVGVRI